MNHESSLHPGGYRRINYRCGFYLTENNYGVDIVYNL
jgi:hypothetical protein